VLLGVGVLLVFLGHEVCFVKVEDQLTFRLILENLFDARDLVVKYRRFLMIGHGSLGDALLESDLVFTVQPVQCHVTKLGIRILSMKENTPLLERLSLPKFESLITDQVVNLILSEFVLGTSLGFLLACE